MTWQPIPVTLADGREVLSDSVEWMLECEARYLLGMEIPARRDMLNKIAERRGPDALKELRQRCFDLEPAYVLDLPGVEARRAYLSRVEDAFGEEPRNRLELKVKALHAERRQRIAQQQAKSA